MTFRFEDENEYEYEIQLNFFSPILEKIDAPKSLIVPFFFSLENIALLYLLKEVKPSVDRKMIKLLTFDNLFPPLRHSR